MVMKKADTFENLPLGTLKKFLKQTEGTKTKIGKNNRKFLLKLIKKKKGIKNL